MCIALSVAITPMAFSQVSPPSDSTVLDEISSASQVTTPVITLDENDLNDAGSQNVSSVLTAGRDPFFSSASFNFSEVRFKVRGYDNDLFTTNMNGIPMDNLDNGFTPFGQWGGLNDVMRNKDQSFGLRYNTFSYGDIGGATNIDARASKQRKQTTFGYAVTNRNYRHRWNFTHSTGLNKQGWAFTVSGSRRWADEGYIPGTYYDGWSYFVAIDKRFSDKSLLSLTVFGAPTENGRQGAAVKELMNLAGTNYYNPNWGYQNGKKRNATVGKTNQPMVILTHDIRLNDKTTITNALGYSFGKRSVSALDWYKAPDPRPDYYRYLPSYYNSVANQDIYQYDQLQTLLTNDESARQINWARLYDANRSNITTVHNANGIIGNDVSGKRSLYVISDRTVYTRRMNFNTVLNTSFGKHVDFSGGITFQNQDNHYYLQVADLLGGDFWLDVNQFGERDFPTDPNAGVNNVDCPNCVVKKGDKYGYNYNVNLTKTAAWAQAVFKYKKVDFFAAAEGSNTKFYRIGNVRNGLYPNDSYGKGTNNNFNNYSVKAGTTYKINGRNYIYASGSIGTKAPYFENVYLSPRTRNTQQSNVTNESFQSFEAGYTMNAPKLKVHLSGYYTHFENQMDVMTFYHDGFQNLVNYALSGIDKLHFGGELGIEAKLTPTITANAVASVGRYYYDSRQEATVTIDNTSDVLAKQTIYSDNFRIPSTPQEAYSLGLTYRSPDFWFVSVTGNYYNQSWLSFNPIRRTYSAIEGIPYKEETWNSIIDQTKFDEQFVLNFFGGYSKRLPKKFNINGKRTFLVFNVGVNNILDNQNINTGGFEQLRFDDVNNDINKFPPKLFYMQGINYFISAAFRF